MTSRSPTVRDKRTVRFHKAVTLNPDFKRLWDNISKHTKYRVKVDNDRLVDDVCEKLKASAPNRPLADRDTDGQDRPQSRGCRDERDKDSTKKWTPTASRSFLISSSRSRTKRT